MEYFRAIILTPLLAAFAGEFGLYLFGLLPVSDCSGGQRRVERHPAVAAARSDQGLLADERNDVGFRRGRDVRQFFGVLPPALPYIVVGYLSASMLLALFWFGFRRRHDRD